MTIRRKGANKMVIIVAFLAVLMVLSFPGLSPSIGISESTEREAYEYDYSNRSTKTPIRIQTVRHTQFIVNRTPFHFLMISAAFYFLLTAPWIHLRPFYCLIMKRTLLSPIKFTSKFVV